MLYSKDAEKVINEGYTLALNNNNQYYTSDHLLLRLLENQKIINIFDTLNADIETLKSDMYSYINSKIPKHSGVVRQIPLTEELNILIKSAHTYAVGNGRDKVEVEDILMSYYFFQESFARYSLEKNGLMSGDLKEYFVELFAQKVQQNDDEEFDQSGEPGKAGPQLNFLINLNQKAKDNKIDPVIGRDHEIDRVIHILVRKKKNNPLLVGEPGVGKTAIAEGLAKKIIDGTVHESLAGSTIYALDMGAMTAGTKFRGEFEARLKKVLDKLKKEPKSILFIDEIHTIIGAGASSGGSLDASNILKPALASGEIKCIGATTYKEYRNVFEKDAALSRRFQKVDVSEPTPEDTKQILFGLKKHYEDFHKITYTEKALGLAVDLSVKYVTDRFLPDKAIDVVDEAGAFAKLTGHKEVTEEIVEKVIAKIAKIPERQIVKSEKDKVRELKSNLEMSIFGQEKAIDSLVDAILLSKSGLRENNKPIGSFLFCGPTGVGKTEVTKQLASQLGVNFVRLDMSEYMEKHNVSKLIGAPPGYVGYEQEGVLSSAVSKNPHSVILLDELEKAHPDVWNILLQIMDNGFLTDNYGKKIDFRQAIIVMTSNIGTAEISTRSLGFVTQQQVSVPTQSIEKAFSPEFRNRLDAIIWFNSLNEKTIAEVLDKNLILLDSMLMQKKISISYSKEARAWLAKNGYNPQMGARPMARLVQDKIKVPLSKEILFGKLESGGSVTVDMKDNDLVFTFTQKKEKKSRKVETSN